MAGGYSGESARRALPSGLYGVVGKVEEGGRGQDCRLFTLR